MLYILYILHILYIYLYIYYIYIYINIYIYKFLILIFKFQLQIVKILDKKGIFCVKIKQKDKYPKILHTFL